MTRAVIGAHAMGFNVGSVGVSVIGNYSAATVTPAARAALVSLLAWRLDLAHVDPVSRLVRVSTGNPRYPAGTAVTLNAVSGHRDTYPTSCPGTSLYAQLPAIRTAVARTGLPKIYEPVASGSFGGPKLTYRLKTRSLVTATLLGESGAVVATLFRKLKKPGLQTYAWTGVTVPDGHYRVQLVAQDARGRQAGASVPVTIDGTLASFAPSATAFSRQVELGFALNAPAHVLLRIVSGGVTTATLLDADAAAGSQQIEWDGSGLPDGRYNVVVSVTD